MVRDKRTRAWKNRYFTLKGKTLHQHHRDQKVFSTPFSLPPRSRSRVGRSYSLRGYYLSSSSSSSRVDGSRCNTRCVYL
jgi:hypothetical protein